MNKLKTFILLVSMILLITLACTIPGISQRINEVQETAQSVVTQAQAIATQAAPLLETVQSIATENPEVVTTLQAVITDNVPSGTAPADIPMIDPSQMSDFTAGDNLVSYSTSLTFQEMQTFYQTQMSANGWEPVPSSTYDLPNIAVLTYEKTDRTATVNLTFNPISNTTIVLITIQSK